MVLGSFTGRTANRGRRPATTRLNLERLETREVPAIGTAMIAFCIAHLHQKVGGGECAHLADEALRTAGATFAPQDPQHNGNYVWGAFVTGVSRGHDSKPTARCQLGDVIQFSNV